MEAQRLRGGEALARSRGRTGRSAGGWKAAVVVPRKSEASARRVGTSAGHSDAELEQSVGTVRSGPRMRMCRAHQTWCMRISTPLSADAALTSGSAPMIGPAGANFRACRHRPPTRHQAAPPAILHLRHI